MANKLIQDEGYRTEVGLSYQSFVDEMMREPAKAEQKFTQHILIVFQISPGQLSWSSKLIMQSEECQVPCSRRKHCVANMF